VTSGRASGILLHPTSLPGPHGVGDLGPAAYRFVDYLAAAGQSLWQVLPLGPTGYGDSPYQSLSAFAGNPLLISLDRLADEGLLDRGDLEGAPAFDPRRADYTGALAFKRPRLDHAADRFASAKYERRVQYDAFRAAHAGWLEDFALYVVLKAASGGVAWTDWPRDVAAREEAALDRVRAEKAAEIERVKVQQFFFFEQWAALRAHAHQSSIRLFGDVPIFVAHDSADVWGHRELFRLKKDGRPEVVAGVPPDYFSATGQLWGNPIYRWKEMAKTGYRWWTERLRATLETVDLVRLDHFRGFEAYWEVPAEEKTAVKGKWVKGPGAALFEALEKALGKPLPLVAENLGVITPEVEALRERFGFPGMAILQFAFGADAQASTFIPHHLQHHVAAYTGTHDNDTTVGWWSSQGAGDSTRTQGQVDKERDFALRYLDARDKPIHWAFIRALMASVAEIAVVPLQDVLGLGGEARMNVPARASGNWLWRYAEGDLRGEDAARLRELADLFGRLPAPAGPAEDKGQS
jgi:4-alpha-glucanotransferase